MHEFSTKNGLVWKIGIDQNTTLLPLARNFDASSPPYNQDILNLELSSFKKSLLEKQCSGPRRIPSNEVTHKLLDYFIEENKVTWQELISPGGNDYTWLAETHLGDGNGATDHILIDPREGFYLIMLFQNKSH